MSCPNSELPIGVLLICILSLPPCTSELFAQEQQAGTTTIDAVGTLVPVERSWVYPRFPGRVTATHWQPGRRVEKGEKLLSVISVEIQMRLLVLQDEIKVGKAKLEVLRKGLYDRPSLEIELTGKSVDVEDKIRELKRLNEPYLGGSILSPADGTVISSIPHRLNGRFVSPDSGRPILQIARREGDWHAIVQFDEKDVGRLLQFVRNTKDEQLPVDVVVAALPNQTFKGILALKNIATEMTRGKLQQKAVLMAIVKIHKDSQKELRILPIGVTVQVKVPVSKE